MIRFPARSDDVIRPYRIDVIDTWNMTIEPQGVFRMARKDEYDIHAPDRPVVSLPGRPYMAVRLRAA